MTDKPVKVFISYAREDIDTAKRLYQDLKAGGVKPWMDKIDLIPGQNWKTAIRQAIQQSQFIIPILSTKSVKKRGFVQKEFRYALDVLGEIPEGEIFIIPVRLDDCEVPFEELHDIHWADFFPSYDEGLTSILRAFPVQKAPVQTVKFEATNLPSITNQTKTKFKVQLRRDPLEVSESDFLKVFKLDQDLKPLEYVKNEYEDKEEIVVDHATDLMWEKAGSSKIIIYHIYKEDGYLDDLNSKSFAGYSDWRLPTIDELKSLLEPQEQLNFLYIDQVFSKDQQQCLSADTVIESPLTRCSVNFNCGNVRHNALLGIFVRAVRSINE